MKRSILSANVIISLTFAPFSANGQGPASVRYSRDGKAANITLWSHHYHAEQKGFKPITMPPGVFPSKPATWRDMEMIIYSNCRGFYSNAPVKTLEVYIAFSPHPNDRKSVPMLTPVGLWRTLMEIFRGGAYYREKGVISLEGTPQQSWPILIYRHDVVFDYIFKEVENYHATFSKNSDWVPFVQALRTAGTSQGQATIVLQSPHTTIKAVYKLPPYVVEGFNKQLIKCRSQ